MKTRIIPLPARTSRCSLATDARKRNILLFYADDLTYQELGCYGNTDFRACHDWTLVD
jgi:hypothetical protein